ncbi:hypothetical protein [Ornithobacterium rhinotracheale]|uniref:hypothetical protein n=1 Tax=Ornithobacterium rhinotracheale TaxID=28251 RepID=UPI00403624C2
MKQIINSIIQILSIILVVAIVVHFFVDFGVNGKFWLFTTMFFIIGFRYFVLGFSEGKFWIKIVFIICGLYLMIFKFVMEPDTIFQNLLGILALLLPIFLGRLGYATDDDERV